MNTTTAPTIQNLPANMQNKVLHTEAGCWEWVGARSSSGYGTVWIGGVNYLPHRIAYELLVGPIPEGMQMDHLCRNKFCCNPSHVEPVTAKENMARRPDVRKSHCKHGHELTVENLIVKRRGSGRVERNCRECERVAQRRRRMERAAA